MLEPPLISTEKIISSLHDSFDIKISKLEFLPIGNDSNSWVYKVHADKSYFLKAKRLPVYKPSLTVPHYLKEQGLHQVVAPVPSKTQALYQNLDGFALILYPFIDGDNGMRLGLTDKQWLEYGVFLKNLHAIKLPKELAKILQRETFVPHPERLEITKQFHATVLERNPTNSIEKELIDFWQSKYEEIGKIITRTEDLGRILQKETLEFVLCHADIHTANLLLDKTGNLFVVDWDQPILAPKERDLMFIGASIASSSVDAQKALFYRGYGRTDTNLLALAYYYYEWAIQEFGDYTWRVFLSNAGEETKRQAVHWFRAQFEPDNVIASAYKIEKAL
jgi:spectinomycin phosphotransferase